MITKFIENYAKLIVGVPEDVTVTKKSWLMKILLK